MAWARLGVVQSNLGLRDAARESVRTALDNADPVRKVTIVPRARSMGHTEQIPAMDRYVYDRDYLLDRIAVMLGGRAAEELYKDTATSGAENDLKQATALARRMILDWGMGEQLSAIALGHDAGEVFLGREIAQGRDYGEETASEVDREVRNIMVAAHQRHTAAPSPRKITGRTAKKAACMPRIATSRRNRMDRPA